MSRDTTNRRDIASVAETTHRRDTAAARDSTLRDIISNKRATWTQPSDSTFAVERTGAPILARELLGVAPDPREDELSLARKSTDGKAAEAGELAGAWCLLP